jgi:hypothetical protein
LFLDTVDPTKSTHWPGRYCWPSIEKAAPSTVMEKGGNSPVRTSARTTYVSELLVHVFSEEVFVIFVKWAKHPLSVPHSVVWAGDGRQKDAKVNIRVAKKYLCCFMILRITVSSFIPFGKGLDPCFSSKVDLVTYTPNPHPNPTPSSAILSPFSIILVQTRTIYSCKRILILY